MKGRTQKLETAIQQVAATIEAGDNTDLKITLAEDQLKTYKQRPGGPPAMDESLHQLTSAARDQLTRLNGTRTVLAETKQTLAETRSELKTTQDELASARNDISLLQDTVAAKDMEIAEQEVAIQGLSKEKEILIAQAEEIKVQLEDLEVQNRDLIDQLAEIQIHQEQIAQKPEERTLPKGHQGRVLLINPEWNFLVIGLTQESLKTMSPDVEVLIHRADQLVGKGRINTITDNMAIAEIINDWQQMPPQKGDYVIY